jgi:hypothetical protein
MSEAIPTPLRMPHYERQGQEGTEGKTYLPGPLDPGSKPFLTGLVGRNFRDRESSSLKIPKPEEARNTIILLILQPTNLAK